MYDYIEDSFLEHHGILGQKWGIRRFQNYDGTLKAAGKRRAKTDRDKERAEKKAAKAQAKAEKSKEDLEKAKAKAIASADLNEIMKLRGSMTTEELKDAAARAIAIGNVNKNMPKQKSIVEKLVGAMKTGKEVADSIKGMHESLSSLRKEFGLDAKSILNDNSDGQMTLNDWAKQNKEPDIFDRIKETTGKIAKDAAAKANEKYQEHKFQKDLQKVKDEKANTAISEFMNNIDKSGPKKASSSNSDVDIPSPSLPWSTKPLSQRDLNGNKEAGSAISDFMKSVNSSGSKESGGKSNSGVPPVSLPWSTPAKSIPKPSPQTQKNIDRLIKKGSGVGDVSISDVNDELLKRNNSRLGL